jgi:hypothetical protein
LNRRGLALLGRVLASLGRVVGAVLVFLAAAAPADAGLADRIAATFVPMADDLVKAFQPIEGVVLDADGDRLYLDIGAERGAQVGQEFTVFRKGDAFYHPITGKLLGRYEDVLGYAQVRRALPQLAEAVFIPVPGQARPRVEDGVRISRGRIKVAIAPVLDLTASAADVRRVPYLFAVLLERSKRFQVVDPLVVSDTITTQNVRVEELLARPERAIPLGQTLEVSAWLVPILLRRGNQTYLDTTWVSAVTGTALFSRREILQATNPTEEQRFPWEPLPED